MPKINDTVQKEYKMIQDKSSEFDLKWYNPKSEYSMETVKLTFAFIIICCYWYHFLPMHHLVCVTLIFVCSSNSIQPARRNQHSTESYFQCSCKFTCTNFGQFVMLNTGLLPLPWTFFYQLLYPSNHFTKEPVSIEHFWKCFDFSRLLVRFST